MKRGLLILSTLALGLATLLGCGTADAPPSASTLVEPAAYERIVADPRYTVVNVHVPFEGAIEGTDLFIPFDQVEQQVGLLPADRSAPLAIYCMSGTMSADAAHTLARLGYTDVVDLAGGMQAWQAAGKPLVHDPPR